LTVITTLTFEQLMSEASTLEFLLVVRRSFIQPAIELARLAEAGNTVCLPREKVEWYKARIAEYVETRDKFHAVNAEIQERISCGRSI